jgi:DNA-binding MltR family transcriptional regulator
VRCPEFDKAFRFWLITIGCTATDFPLLRSSKSARGPGVTFTLVDSMSDLTDRYWDRLHKELDNETDRSIVIVACALLDEALKETIKARLLPAAKKDWCVFTGGNSPISSFSARINLCYQLSLISDFMQRDLHIIRRLRNDFAHDPFELSFNSDSVKSRVEELDKVANYREKNPESRSDCGPPGTKYDFIFAISWRLYSLTESQKEYSSAKKHIPEFGYLDFEKLKQLL